MPATVAGSHLGLDTHANRPAANAAGQPFGALYSCSDHLLVYKTDGSTWSTWASLTGSGIAASLADAAGDILVASAADTWAKLTIGAAGTIPRVLGGTLTYQHGGVVQIVRDTDTANFTNSTTSYTDSGASVAITPLYSDSILEIEVSGEFQAYRIAGTPLPRYGWVNIRNATDAVDVASSRRGFVLVAGSTATGEMMFPIALRGFYTVNSLTARTFTLQIKSGEATNVEAAVRGDVCPTVITVKETRP